MKRQYDKRKTKINYKKATNPYYNRLAVRGDATMPDKQEIIVFLCISITQFIFVCLIDDSIKRKIKARIIFTDSTWNEMFTRTYITFIL